MSDTPTATGSKSASVKRFDPIEYFQMGGNAKGEVIEDTDGDYVRFEDYERELAAMTAQRDQWKRATQKSALAHIATTAERDRYKAAVERIADCYDSTEHAIAREALK